MTQSLTLHVGSLTGLSRQLNWIVRRNRKGFAKHNTSLVLSRDIGKIFDEAVKRYESKQIDEDFRSSFIQGLGAENANETFLSLDRFLGARPSIFGTKEDRNSSTLYPDLGSKVGLIKELFPNHSINLAVTIESMSSFGRYLSNKKPSRAPDKVFRRFELLSQVSWIEFIKRLRRAIPEAAIVVISQNDVLYEWPKILESLFRMEDWTRLENAFDFPNAVLPEDEKLSLARCKEIATPFSPLEYLWFIQQFPNLEVTSLTAEGLGFLQTWTGDFADRLDEIYDDQLYQFREIDGVELI